MKGTVNGEREEGEMKGTVKEVKGGEGVTSKTEKVE